MSTKLKRFSPSPTKKAFWTSSAGAIAYLKKPLLVGIGPLDGPTTPPGHMMYDLV
jgi:hypothetical protein